MSPRCLSSARCSRGIALLLMLSGITGCQECGPFPPDGGTDGGTDGFHDHTVPFLESEARYFELAAEGAGTSAVKFIVTDFTVDSARDIRWYDSTFYTLHDEWYWFRLLNGAAAPGDDFFTPYAGSFETIPEIYDWARQQGALPLDLTWVSNDTRLYSPRFYAISLATTPRAYGVGTLIHVAERPDLGRGAIWAIELEYTDSVDHAELVTYFEMVLSSVPASIADEIRWLVRSTEQEELAQAMEAGQLQYHERIIRYDELTVPGEAEVYSEGVTAGRLRMIRAGEGGLESTSSSDFLILEEVPDFLPACAGLITAVPQTPLAHINVLARNRGIPNAYLGGALTDPNLEQLARVRAAVAVRAIAPDTLQIVPMSDSDWATWRALNQPPDLEITEPDLTDAPYTLDLAEASLANVDELRPFIGGKAAGFLALLEPGDVITPEWPMAITARAYAEHLAPFRGLLEDMLDENDFRTSALTRLLVLEGPNVYSARYPTGIEAAHKDEVMQEHPPGTPLGDLIAAGGVTGLLKNTPIDPATAALLRGALEEQFAPFAATQGLRFRSSSTVEDIEGFNGAGLYTSNSGWLFPEPGDRDVEDALKLTWASYWGLEAFEERRLARVDHLKGHMAVLVHARFDDDLEVSNGVFTFTELPPDVEGKAVLEMNAQTGSLSVTNPPPGSTALPEVDRVYLDDDDTLRIERVATSTELPAGSHVLSDAALLEIFASARQVTQAWLVQENADVLSAQRRRTQTLDFEYREMDVGWPALANGNSFGRRLVIKQARSLEPSLVHLPTYVQQHPFPRDVLGRARRVERRVCTGDIFEMTTVEAYTDPLLAPDLGYSESPFTAFLTFEFRIGVPSLGFDPGDRLSVVHLSFVDLEHPGVAEGGAWALDTGFSGGVTQAYGLTHLSISPEKAFTLSGTGGNLSGNFASCQLELQYASPDEFLDRLFEDADLAGE